MASVPPARLPTEVELVYEVMPCQNMRVGQEPPASAHSCAYFRKWGTYHAYDYVVDDAPAGPGIIHPARYVDRRYLLPELLSGCRKAPIMAVGINPNLPAWWSSRRRSMYPDFDDYQQYAHYFRYRAVEKVQLSRDDYEAAGGGPHDTPFSDFTLDIPRDENGNRLVQLRRQPQRMYGAYQDLLVRLGEGMGWTDHELTVGEDLAYGNMVACASAKWTTRPAPNDPDLPPMTREERSGIVTECFRERRYFLRQLFQSLPKVLLIFSNSTARAFIGEMQDRFVEGDPRPNERVSELMERTFRLEYGDGLEARVIFAPHVTGRPEDFEPARERVAAQLIEEARAGNLSLNASTGHLRRPRGGCVLCPMLQIGPCDYEGELEPLSDAPALLSASSPHDIERERAAQDALRGEPTSEDVDVIWEGTDETDDAREEEL